MTKQQLIQELVGLIGCFDRIISTTSEQSAGSSILEECRSMLTLLHKRLKDRGAKVGPEVVITVYNAVILLHVWVEKEKTR